MTTQQIRIEIEQGEGGWFYATSPDLKGLLVARETREELEQAIPQAIRDLDQAKDLIKQAHRHIAQGDIDQATQLIAEAKANGADPYHLQMTEAYAEMRQRNWQTALQTLNRLANQRPTDYAVHFNAGLCYFELGNFETAIKCHRTSITINPSIAITWSKLAGALLATEKWAEALACHERAISIEPDNSELRSAYATTITIFEDDAYAETQYRRALESNTHPERYITETALGHNLLRQGKYEEGWPYFAQRSKLHIHGTHWNQRSPEHFQGTKDDLRNKRILLHAEQGEGDSIQFARYILPTQRLADQVTVALPPSLTRLIGNLKVSTHPINRIQEIIKHHVITISLMQLAQVFGTTTTNIPPPAAYQATPNELIDKPDYPMIGLCWHGAARPEDPGANVDDKRRSIDINELRNYLPPAIFYKSLQQEHLPNGDWQDTANIIQNLDLVVTVDTAVAHLAASLNKPTWLLARKGGCWRWGTSGTTTPWYPSMTIYRQTILSDWRPTLKQLGDDLRAYIQTFTRSGNPLPQH